MAIFPKFVTRRRRLIVWQYFSLLALASAGALSACHGDTLVFYADKTADTETVSQETIGEVNVAAAAGTDVQQPGLQPTTLTNSTDAIQITEVVLVTGQSNALGADSSYNAMLDEPHQRAFAYTEDGWQVADLNQVWDLGWHPRNNPDTDPSNNFGFHFARSVAQRRPDTAIGFILVTAPGAAISHWDYESEFYMKIRNKITNALNQLPGKASIDGVL